MVKPTRTWLLKRIGTGGYGHVYRLSPRRIVKVYHDFFDEKEKELLLKDEIRGGKRKGCLPVLKVIEVEDSKGHKSKGLVKRLLPHRLTRIEWDSFACSRRYSRWDDKCSNYMKDSKGNIFQVDTQTEAANLISSSFS